MWLRRWYGSNSTSSKRDFRSSGAFGISLAKMSLPSLSFPPPWRSSISTWNHKQSLNRRSRHHAQLADCMGSYDAHEFAPVLDAPALLPGTTSNLSEQIETSHATAGCSCSYLMQKGRPIKSSDKNIRTFRESATPCSMPCSVRSSASCPFYRQKCRNGKGRLDDQRLKSRTMSRQTLWPRACSRRPKDAH